MATAQLDPAALKELSASFRGLIVQPGDGSYDEHRKVWNGSIDRHPAVIARCAGTEDVIGAIKFAQQTGFPMERMNPYGSSLIYGHPQGPTGLRGIVELAHALAEAGGGIGLFTGCAAGDSGAALVLRVD